MPKKIKKASITVLAFLFVGLQFTWSQENNKNVNDEWAYDILNIPAFKNEEKPTKIVVIAVIDDGFNLEHQEIAPFIVRNAKEKPNNLIDDDGNGKIDDYTGWDVSDNDNDVSVYKGQEITYYHGTFVASVIVKVAKRYFGDSLAHKHIKILPIKAVSDNALQTYLKDGYVGLDYAIEQEVDIICMAWSGGNPGREDLQLLQKATDKGILMVASAGNFNQEANAFPASFHSVLSVAGTNASLQKQKDSNYGDRVDLCAPAEYVKGAHPLKINAYVKDNGTSVSAALVAGVAALVKVNNPQFSGEKLKQSLINSAVLNTELVPAHQGKLGSGLISAINALQYARHYPFVSEYNIPSKSKGSVVFSSENFEENVKVNPTGAYSGFNITIEKKINKSKRQLNFVISDTLWQSYDVNSMLKKIYVPSEDFAVYLTGKSVKNKNFIEVQYEGVSIDSSTVYCEETQVFTSDSGKIEDGSDMYNYANNCSCKWQIKVPKGKRIQIDFESINTEATVDYVYIANGTVMLQENIVARLSGKKLPPTIYSATNELLIWFVSNGKGTKPGWKLSYKTID